MWIRHIFITLPAVKAVPLKVEEVGLKIDSLPPPLHNVNSLQPHSAYNKNNVNISQIFKYFLSKPQEF